MCLYIDKEACRIASMHLFNVCVCMCANNAKKSPVAWLALRQIVLKCNFTSNVMHKWRGVKSLLLLKGISHWYEPKAVAVAAVAGAAAAAASNNNS